MAIAIGHTDICTAAAVHADDANTTTSVACTQAIPPTRRGTPAASQPFRSAGLSVLASVESTTATDSQPPHRQRPGVLRRLGTAGALLVWTDLAKASTNKHDPRALRASLRAIATPLPGQAPLSLRALCQLAHALGRAWRRHGSSSLGTLERTLLVDALDALSYQSYLIHLGPRDDPGATRRGKRDVTPSNLCQLLEVGCGGLYVQH